MDKSRKFWQKLSAYGVQLFHVSFQMNKTWVSAIFVDSVWSVRWQETICVSLIWNNRWNPCEPSENIIEANVLLLMILWLTICPGSKVSWCTIVFSNFNSFIKQADRNITVLTLENENHRGEDTRFCSRVSVFRLHYIH